MSKFCRFALVGILTAMLIGIAAKRSALAQVKINFGGSNQSSNKPNNNEDDENRNSRRNRRNNQSNDNSNTQQFQQFIQGQPGGQNNQGGSNQQFQNRRSNAQGQFPGSQQFSGQHAQSYQQGQNGLQFGNVQLNDWQTRNWQGSRNVQKWSQTYGNGPQPFSKNWYNNHPKAWHHNHDHWDDHVWVVATTDGVAAWLGWAQPRGTRVVYGYHPSGVSSQQIYDPNYFGEWYPLGVYSLVTGPYDNGTRMMQLAVDRQGNVAGSYYDLITDTSHNVSGRIYQKSQNVYWTLSSNKNLKFRSSLGQLTQPQGTVIAKLPGGDQQWQLVRLENYDN